MMRPFFKEIFPFHEWMKTYSRSFFISDTISGITLATYAIPVSLAYATLAGLPPQYGIYGYLIGGIIYALLGTGRHLAIGPTSAISLIIGVSLSGLSGGNIEKWISLASATALLLGGMSILAYFLRLNSIINFISETVLLGFKAGAAIAIAVTQLPKLFGVAGGGTTTFERINTLVSQLPGTSIGILIFGILAICLIFFGEKYFPAMPVKLMVVTLSILVVTFTPVKTWGLQTVGIIPSGLPGFHFPKISYSEFESILPLTFACFLLAYIESVSAARTLARENNYEIDSRRELLAIGASNIVVALGTGYPVSGGLSQSVINAKAGAKTPVSLVIASITLTVCLLFLTGLLKNLPSVMLSCIVLVAISSLVDIKEFIRLGRVNRFDFLVAMIALICVISFGILQGVVLSALASLIILIRIASTPHVAFLGKIPGFERYSDISRHPENQVIPNMLLFRVEAPLLYFNISYIYEVIWKKVISMKDSLKLVIFDLSTSAYVDSSGARMIRKLHDELQKLGIEFNIVEAHSEVRDILRIEDLENVFGHISRKVSVEEVVDSAREKLENQYKRKKKKK